VATTIAELGADYAPMINVEPYFVDFMREPPEAQGDEPDDFDFSAPKIYEPIPSFDGLKERLTSYVSGSTYAAFTHNCFDDQERNLIFVKTDFQVFKLKIFCLQF